MKKSALYTCILLTISSVASAQSLPPNYATGSSPAFPPAFLGGGTQAPVVPAIVPAPGGMPAAAFPTPSEPPPPVNLLSSKDATLTRQEEADVAMARKWMDSRNVMAAGANGAVTHRLGAGMPALVCAPLYVCDISLQPGELVNNVLVGDPVRWNVSPATSGAGANATVHMMVKPSDIGLTTNLIVTTDRRTYSLKLVSRENDYTPAIAFSYPEDEQAAWSKLSQEQATQRAATVLPESGGLRVDKLDFDYAVGGDKPAWKPVRVYSDGTKTYIEFPHEIAASDMPVLVAVGENKSEEMVNYRVNGDRFVVDKVIDRAELLSGVGHHQVEVTIRHTRG